MQAQESKVEELMISLEIASEVEVQARSQLA